MAKRTPLTQAKRKRELAKKEKRKAKEERRALRKQQKALNSTPALKQEKDPDLTESGPDSDPIQD
jgi:hypothetical protein